MGAYMLEQLNAKLGDLPCVGRITVRGLFGGIEFVADKATKEFADEAKVIAVCGEAAREGVLLGRMNRSVPGKNTAITLAPAYV